MTKWAFPDPNNGTLVDVTEIDPAKIFVAEYAAQFVEVPDDTNNGDVRNSKGKIEKKEFVAPPEVVQEKVLTEADFLSSLTRDERKGIKAARASNEDLDDFMTMLEKRTLVNMSDADNQADVKAFVTAKLISQASADKILP
ncbi:MAG: hypothetical protein CMJ39_00155 [Phycisphaerae bacterium]|nr:hypothetical protein [Phycisphaerae bacterium]